MESQGLINSGSDVDSELGRMAPGFAVVFLLGFGLSLIAAAYVYSDEPCDVPAGNLLVFYGACVVVGGLMYFLLTFVFTTLNTRKGSIFSPATGTLYIAVGMQLLSGMLVCYYYFTSDSCYATAPIMFKWLFSALLSFLIIIFLFTSVPLIKAGFPICGKCGFAGIQCFATGLQTVTSGLTKSVNWCMNAAEKASRYGEDQAGGSGVDGVDGSVGKAGGLGKAGGTFPYYVNNTVLCWFFAYFIIEVQRNWNADCDVPLHTYILVFAIFGLVITLGNFYYDMLYFNKPAPNPKGKAIRLLVVTALLIFWGIMGLIWVNSSKTCSETAVQIYRLSSLLTYAFYVLVFLVCFTGGLVGMDFVCSGKLRIVLVLDKGR